MAVAVLTPLAISVRRVLSGADDGQTGVVDRIGRPPGAPGWFQPGDAVWTVHGSVATFLGGVRSLLLQTLHPLALAGVERHSRYREDPLGRLQRTGAFIAATTYGPDEFAEQTVGAIRAMHDKVEGTAPDGRRYSAADPRLLLWVHLTLVDSMLTAYQIFGRHGAVDPDRYVADMAVVGERMGVPHPPRTAPALAASLSGFAPELRRTGDTDRMKRFIMSAPLPAGLRPGYAILAGPPATACPAGRWSCWGSRRRPPRAVRPAEYWQTRRCASWRQPW